MASLSRRLARSLTGNTIPRRSLTSRATLPPGRPGLLRAPTQYQYQYQYQINLYKRHYSEEPKPTSPAEASAPSSAPSSTAIPEVQIPPEWEEAERQEKRVQELCNELNWMDAIDLLHTSYKTRREILHRLAPPKEKLDENQILMIDAPLIQPMLQLGGLYRSVGLLKEAKTFFRLGIKTMQGTRALMESSSKEDPNYQGRLDSIDALLAGLHSDLGLTLEAMKDYEAAQENFKDAISILVRLGHENHLQTALIRAHLAMLYESLGNVEEAKPLHIKVLSVYPHVRVIEIFVEYWPHPQFATALHPLQKMTDVPTAPIPNYVSNYTLVSEEPESPPTKQRGEDLTEDRATVESLLKLQLAHLDPEDLSVAPLFLLRGTIMRLLKDYDAARTALTGAFQIYRKNKGDRHITIATCLCHFGLLNLAEGKHDDAEQFFKEALLMKREILGDTHPHIALIEYDLALVLWKKMKIQDALFLLQDAESILRNSIGASHPITETISGTRADVEFQVNLAIETMKKQRAEAGPDLSILSEDKQK